MSRTSKQVKTTGKPRKGTLRFTISANRASKYDLTDGYTAKKKDRFNACVWMGGKGARSYSSVRCSTGPNPRAALKGALRHFIASGGPLRKKGAFKGIK